MEARYELLTVQEVALMLGVSTRSVLRWEEEGKFPRGFMISPREKRWRKLTVLCWIDDQDHEEEK